MNYTQFLREPFYFICSYLPERYPSLVSRNDKKLIWLPDNEKNTKKVQLAAQLAGIAAMNCIFSQFWSTEQNTENLPEQKISYPFYCEIEGTVTAAAVLNFVWEIYNLSRAARCATVKTATAVCTYILDPLQKEIESDVGSWLINNQEIARKTIANELARKLRWIVPLSQDTLSTILNKTYSSLKIPGSHTIRDLLTPSEFYGLSHQEPETFCNLCVVFPEYLQWGKIQENINKVNPTSLTFISNQLAKEQPNEDILDMQFVNLFKCITNPDILGWMLDCEIYSLDNNRKRRIFESLLEECTQLDSLSKLKEKILCSNSSFMLLSNYFSYFVVRSELSIPIDLTNRVVDAELKDYLLNQINYHGATPSFSIPTTPQNSSFDR